MTCPVNNISYTTVAMINRH